MLSIYNKFKGLHKDGKPLDFLATWKKTFDKASEREVNLFQEMYCDRWCEYNEPQMSLTVEAVVGKYRLRFMATLIGNESPTPLRRSDGFDIWTGEIPRVGHKFPMTAREYRKINEVYENPRLSEASKVRAIEKTLRNDMEGSYLGCKDVMDYILLTAFSNWGVCQFVPELNNPGGRKYEVDYQMGEANKKLVMAQANIQRANSLAKSCCPRICISGSATIRLPACWFTARIRPTRPSRSPSSMTCSPRTIFPLSPSPSVGWHRIRTVSATLSSRGTTTSSASSPLARWLKSSLPLRTTS